MYNKLDTALCLVYHTFNASGEVVSRKKGEVDMNALEKVAWTELLVSVTTLVVVTALYPWFGDGATGAFGLLGVARRLLLVPEAARLGRRGRRTRSGHRPTGHRTLG